MTERTVAPYGSWRSPISSDLIVSGTVALAQIELDGEDTYWIEGRPAEGGRCVVVRCTPGGEPADVTPQGFNVRTRVHEYGGGAYTVDAGEVFFSSFDDNRVYRQTTGSPPQPITPGASLRYADFTVDRRRGRLISVREDHSSSDREAINTIVAIPLSGSGEQRVLVCGGDFYSSPRLSPDGSQLCWLTWNHPNMPWDGTELWIGALAPDGSIAESRRVAGGSEESIFQPQWSPDGLLYFVSDRTGWWNIYRQRGQGIEELTQGEAEFGLPQWVFGMSTYGFASAGCMVCVDHFGGTDRLLLLDIQTRALEPINTLYSEFNSVRASSDRAVFDAASPTHPHAVVQLDLTSRRLRLLRSSADVPIDAEYLSVPTAIDFPTENGHTAHGLYYAPRNPDYSAPPGEKPPLIVRSHGGPTGAAASALNLNIQYWTSRGFAVLDVNYGGSTGYGRAFRERLNGKWGIVDVDDCVNGARYLAGQGLVDPNRLIIVGGSAGGYTTLVALTQRDTFAAGASHFGISDLEPWDFDTHKFESRYLDRLVGLYAAAHDVYRQRSPIHFVEQASGPIILFQGLDDKVVPSNQAELMVSKLRAAGLPFAYMAFEGEGHGFRKAENIKRALDGELYFYSRVFGFELPEPVEPVPIENLPEGAGTAAPRSSMRYPEG